MPQDAVKLESHYWVFRLYVGGLLVFFLGLNPIEDPPLSVISLLIGFPFSQLALDQSVSLEDIRSGNDLVAPRARKISANLIMTAQRLSSKL